MLLINLQVQKIKNPTPDSYSLLFKKKASVDENLTPGF